MKRLIQTLLLITIACTPVFALREFLKSSGFNVPSYGVYFNLLKDFLLFLVTTLSTIHLLYKRQYPANALPFFIGFTGFTLLVCILSAYDILMVIGGLRWALPFFLVFLLVGHIDKKFLEKLAYPVIGVLLINTTIQAYQEFNQQFRWGPSMYAGVIGRVSGFFELPSIASLYGCLSYVFIRYFLKGNRTIRRILMVVAIMDVFLLSLSTTGFVLMLLLLIVPFVYRPGKFRMVYAVAALALSVFVYLQLDLLNGRYPGDSSVSWNIRVRLIEEAWYNSNIISNQFGKISNSAMLIKGFFGDTLTTDFDGGESLYPAILVNYGIIFFFLLSLILVTLTIRVLLKGNEPLFIFFLLAILGAFTVRISESFPVSILVAILAAYFIQYKNDDTLQAT